LIIFILCTGNSDHSVVAAIENHVHFGSLSQMAFGFTDLASRIDKLFDSLNSSCTHAACMWNSCNSALAGSNHGTVDPKTGARSRTMPSIRGWIITIRAMLDLSDELFSNHSVNFLRTRNLTSDAVENAFSEFRAAGDRNSNPTAAQFGYSLRHNVVNSLLGSTYPVRKLRAGYAKSAAKSGHAKTTAVDYS